jgi:glycosyltransferase involved in cell wall biosynthesis
MVNKLYPPWNGGMELYLAQLSECLVANGVDVTAIVGQAKPAAYREETIHGVRVVRGATLARVARTPIVPRFGAVLRHVSPDLYHFHAPYPWGELAALAARLEAPWVVTYYHDVVRQRIAGLFYRQILRRLLTRARRIIVWTDQLLASSPVLAPHRDKVIVMPGAIDTTRFVPSSESHARANTFRAQYGHAGRIVLFVGRLVYYKGLIGLIEAMQGVEAALVIVGDGPLRADVIAHATRLGIASRVHLLGELSPHDLPVAYQGSDMLVLPSTHKTETFGLVQVEAHASGIPSVCTELGTGTSTANIHGETGLVVPPRAPGALRDAIVRLLSDDVLRRTLGRQGQARAIRALDMKAHTTRMISFYADVLTGG